MFRLSAVVGLAILGTAFVVGTGASQDVKKDKDAVKTKAYLPPGWKALGLSKDQTSEISKIHGAYKGKIKALEDQIQDIKTQEAEDRPGAGAEEIEPGGQAQAAQHQHEDQEALAA